MTFFEKLAIPVMMFQFELMSTSSCDCRDKSNCPLPHLGCIAEKSVVYLARVVRDDNGHVESYAGLTGDTFKTRWRGHKSDFDHREKRGSTEPAGYIWELKDSNIPYTISWDILRQGPKLQPCHETCRLCSVHP